MKESRITYLLKKVEAQEIKKKPPNLIRSGGFKSGAAQCARQRVSDVLLSGIRLHRINTSGEP
jgi:hypothetical protein